MCADQPLFRISSFGRVRSVRFRLIFNFPCLSASNSTSGAPLLRTSPLCSPSSAAPHASTRSQHIDQWKPLYSLTFSIPSVLSVLHCFFICSANALARGNSTTHRVWNASGRLQLSIVTPINHLHLPDTAPGFVWRCWTRRPNMGNSD